MRLPHTENPSLIGVTIYGFAASILPKTDTLLAKTALALDQLHSQPSTESCWNSEVKVQSF